MPLNIPMPSLDRSGLFEGLLHGHQRQDRQRQMEMQQKHHEDTHAIQQQQQARLAELQPYVIDQYKQNAAMHPFIMEQYKLAQALAPLERQWKIAQINAAISAQAQKEFDQNFVKQFMGGQMGGQGSPMQQPGVQMPGQQPMPQPGQPNVAPPSMEQLQQGFGGHNVHPVVAAKMKKLSGWDPNEQTPDQKRASDLQQFREKEEIKKQMKGEEDLTKPTKAVITQQQNIVAAGNNLISQLKKLQTVKSPNAIGYISPGDRAKYLTEVGKAADTLMTTYKWLGIESSLDMAKQMTTRQLGEKDAQYAARLKGLEEEAIERVKNAQDILKSNKIEAHKFEKNSSEKIYNPATRSWE